MTEAAAAVLTSSYWTSMTVGRGIYTAAAAAGSSLNCAALALDDDMPLMPSAPPVLSGAGAPEDKHAFA
jgi:hypothetical protein